MLPHRATLKLLPLLLNAARVAHTPPLLPAAYVLPVLALQACPWQQKTPSWWCCLQDKQPLMRGPCTLCLQHDQAQAGDLTLVQAAAGAPALQAAENVGAKVYHGFTNSAVPVLSVG
jgi:hypothetical protein